MNDDSMIKIMQSLGLDYNPAIESTKEFQGSIKTLNEQLADLNANALKSAKDINTAFTSHLREMNKFYANMEKQNKPIEIKVVTDKAENAMNNFAKSMGIKLDKNLKEQFKGLSDNLLGNFDQSKFDDLAQNIANSYKMAMDKQSKQMEMDIFNNSEDKAIYDYLNKATLRLDESTINAKKNVDGFSQAIRNLTTQSKDAGLSLDQMAQEMEGQGIKSFGANTEDIAERMTKAVQNVRNGLQHLGSDIPTAEIEQFVRDQLTDLIVNLNKVEMESKQVTTSLQDMATTQQPLKDVSDIMAGLEKEVSGLGIVTTKTFKDMNNEVYKYIDTYTNLKKSMSISDTHIKNDDGGFDFAGRVVNDQRMTIDAKAISQAHAEALKLNKVYDDNLVSIKQSNLEQMKAQAASIQQRATTKGLSQEYAQQASTLREQLAAIQARLQAEGKLTAEEVKQTQQLKEQLDILKAQTKTAVADEIRENPSTFGQEWERRSSWFLTGTMFYGTMNAAKEANETIKDVEMGMVELARVMDDTSFVFKNYRNELFQLGIDYGQTFENVQAIALRWAQSGYNVADSLELTKTSLLALNTAELDATNATESMIGIMAQWQLQAQDMALVMDKINITADNYSVTSQDLVDGLLRSSGAARNMNMTLDETIGLLTVMREASGRTGREVGNALNSILSYITRGKSIDTLEGLGIQMFTDETETQFRNAMDIFKDISASWNSLSMDIQDGFVAAADDAGLFNEELAATLDLEKEWDDIQKRDASQSAAGTHRRNYFIGMIERMANAQEVLNNMMDAGGYSMQENADTMETLEKKAESLKASAEALAVAIGDAGLEGALKALVDGGTGALNAINDLDDGTKDFILATLSTFTAVKTLELGMKTFGIQLPGISQIIGSLTSGTWSLTTALKAGSAGMGAFIAANGPLLALSAGIGIIIALTNSIKKQREESEKAIEVFNQQKDVYNEVNQLLPIYESLAEKTSLTTEENQKLIETKQQLINLLPQSATALDSENLSLSEQVAILKDLNEKELDYLKLKAQSVLSEGEDKYQRNIQNLEKQKKLLEEAQKAADRLSLKALKSPLNSFESRDLEIYVDKIENARDKILALETETKAYEDAVKTLDFILNDLGNTLDDAADSADNLGKITFDSATAYEKMNKVVKDATSDLKTLNQALYDVRNGKSLNLDTILDLIENYNLSVDAIKETTDGYTIEASALENLRKVKIKAAIDSAEAAMSDALVVKRQIESNLKNYGLEIEQIGNLVDARKALGNQSSGEWRNSITAGRVEEIGIEAATLEAQEKYMQEGLALAKEYNKTLDEIEEIQKRSDFLKSALSNPNYGVSTSKSSSKDKKYENKALDESLKLLEHRKRISEETQDSIKAEITELYRINSLYVKTADERMNMAERIYSAEKRLRDATLQHSVNWINERKNYNELSIDEEIAAWERVKNNQIDNIEAVKQANLELYKLRNQVISDSFDKEESYIQHITKLGLLSIEEQIEKYRELYEVKASSMEEELAETENLFNLYKNLISDQQKSVKKAHDERIEQIEEEAKKKKAIHEEEIKAIEKELDLLNREEDEYSHDKKMADLREQLAYWQVRTSEDARKKVADLNKQIAEEERKREVDLQKQTLEDRKKTLQDEVKSVEDSAKEEREKLDKSYKQIEIAFDEHSINLIALASTMSKDMFDEFEKNYLIPMENALRNQDYDSIDNILGGVDDFAKDAYDKTYNSNNAQIYRLANQILGYKQQYEVANDKTAAQRAVSAYDKLSRISTSAANNLHSMSYMQAQEYVKNLPKMHSGGKSLSYGAVEMMPGELVFPPTLSAGLEKLFPLLSNLGKSNISTDSRSFNDNRKEVKVGTLLNVENMHMEDDVDGEILARELQRQISSIR